jgi:hypothetical protein
MLAVQTSLSPNTMNAIRLNPLDAAWIVTETRATPNHVGGLLQFKLRHGTCACNLRSTKTRCATG